MSNYKTEQEIFWAGNFGDAYTDRNQGEELLASNLNFFTKALHHIEPIETCLEFGANLGMNLKTLHLLFPKLQLKGIEINKGAADELAKMIGDENVLNQSIFDIQIKEQVELTLIKGVLIHINPDMLSVVYQKLYELSSRYILIAEYYNPSPVTIPYRGHSDKLFKRDFAGEMLDRFSDLKLVDYGFGYKRDPKFPVDDITWFLLEKQS